MPEVCWRNFKLPQQGGMPSRRAIRGADSAVGLLGSTISPAPFRDTRVQAGDSQSLFAMEHAAENGGSFLINATTR
jgi:hypothetical protein